MRKSIIIIILCILGIITASFSGAYQNSYLSTNGPEDTHQKNVGIKGDNLIKIETKAIPRSNNNIFLDADNQITFSEFDEENPTVDISNDGNPFLLYHIYEGFDASYIAIQRSNDLGKTWPEDLIWFWPPSAFDDALAVNPDIGFMGDGIHAYGTNDILSEDPFVFVHDYVDINDPESWTIYYWDRTSTSSYITECDIATNGSNLAIGTIMDYEGSTDYFEDTLLIMWDTNGLDDLETDGGVYWLNRDDDGNSLSYSHLSADAGDKMFFVFQRQESYGKTSLYCAYCQVDETTEYTDWSQRKVAGSQTYNCSYPDISVSGKNAYIVYSTDINGNQDVYVSTSTSGNFWRRYPVVASEDDEMYPVVYANGDKATCLFYKNGDLYKTITEDTGKTWSLPEKINDLSNSIIGGFHFADIQGPYGFWTDGRNGNSDIYYEEIGFEPIITIDSINGGFGAKATVSNVGNAPGSNIPWSIEINGGIILVGALTEDIITIDVGESKTINSGLIFGIGKVTINIQVDEAKKSSDGFLLGPFIIGVN
jgi:hypothetical protein